MWSSSKSHIITAKKDLAIKYVFSQVLRKALSAGIIGKRELFYGTDDLIMEKIKASTDPYVRRLLRALGKNDIKISKGSIVLKAKPRYVDPKFLEGGKVYLSTEASSEYKRLVERRLLIENEGYHVSIKAGKTMFA